jgi:hypothetical protein
VAKYAQVRRDDDVEWVGVEETRGEDLIRVLAVRT